MDLMDYSGTVKKSNSAESDLLYRSLQDVLDLGNIFKLPRPILVIFWQINDVVVLSPCPKNLPETKWMSFQLMSSIDNFTNA